ncbi:MAG: tryptophan--tRNA ligase [Clostridia bacterium]|nr:tryptophan--tRNA ligase [Clostridia bacterium]
MDKKMIFSGVQPSGCVTLGNYIGALKNWVKLQEEYHCMYSVVDLHSITVRQDPEALRERCLSFLALYLACGIDPEKSILFFQSHVTQHAELSWLLSCHTYMGELSRMTQFKDKSAKHEDNINAGLFTYPVLMAADILLYQTDLVPVGADQTQHLELARDIAIRMNHTYGEDTFVVPEGYYAPVGARIMSLQDPTSKMSKSDPNPNGYIWVLDAPEVIAKKIKRAVTDSDGVIAYQEGKHGVNNLLSIYGAVTGQTPQKAAEGFAGQGYGALKTQVAEAVIEELRPVREKYAQIIADKEYLTKVYKDGAEKASALAEKTLEKIQNRLGFVKRG